MGDGWIEKRIGDIAEVVGGSTPSTRDPKNFDGDIPWITPKDLARPHARYVARGERNLSKKGLESCSAKLLPKNSVLLSSRAPIGYLAISANALATNQGFRSLIVRPEYDYEYVYYWLRANVWELERRAEGSTFKELSGSNLKQIRIRLPARRVEQRAIAHILGTLDDKIELNRKMSETLEAMARAVFKSWFVDFDPVRAKMDGRWRKGQSLPGLPAELWDLFPSEFEESELGPIPKGWRISALGDVIAVNPPRHLKRKDSVVYLEMSKMPTSSARVINWSYRPATNGTRFMNGDTLVARITPCLENGKTCFVDFLPDGDVGVGSTEYLVLRPNEDVLPSEFAYFLARSERFRAYAIGNMTGTSGRQRVAAESVRRFPLPVPNPLTARVFGSLAREFLTAMKARDEESKVINELRDTLLPKLVSGELRIPDAERLVAEL